MNLDRRHIRAMCLAGTVSVPQKMPQLARLTVQQSEWPVTGAKSPTMLVAEHQVSPKLTITRHFHLPDVAAVFVPDNGGDVDLDQGTWLLGDEIEAFVATLNCSRQQGPLGIAYVREQAQVLMHVVVGMTAAESAEYYPPLPNDPSVDHYEIPSAGPAAMCSGAATSAGPAAMCSGVATMCSGLADPEKSPQDAATAGPR